MNYKPPTKQRVSWILGTGLQIIVAFLLIVVVGVDWVAEFSGVMS